MKVEQQAVPIPVFTCAVTGERAPMRVLEVGLVAGRATVTKASLPLAWFAWQWSTGETAIVSSVGFAQLGKKAPLFGQPDDEALAKPILADDFDPADPTVAPILAGQV